MYIHIYTGIGVRTLTVEGGKGVLDEEAKDVYMFGQCHALAWELKNLTGNPIYGLGGCNTSPAHCVVYVPSRHKFLDINGLNSLSWFKDNHPFLGRITLKDVSSIDFPFYSEPNLEVGKIFAKTILQKVGLRQKGVK